MDEYIFHLLNGINGKSGVLDFVLEASQRVVVKALPFMMVFWGLWFWTTSADENSRRRSTLLATLVATIPIVGITRAVANFGPFSERPITTPGLEVNIASHQDIAQLDGWSSMPSDHASLFMGLAVAILLVHRPAGMFLIFWAMCVSSIPRVILGLHWPSDLVVGWLLGAIIAICVLRFIPDVIYRSRLVPMFETRGYILYPLLFALTFEIARMFLVARSILDLII